MLHGFFLLSPVLFKTRLFHILKGGGTILGFLLVTVQCAWTPEVQTPIHSSQAGNIVLQTSEKFKIPPQHPHSLSESLVKQMLEGISQRQEHGILQELFISDPKITPVFSHGQIEFLAPHLVEAFSKATTEELIVFRNVENEDGTGHVSGTMAVFSPTIFFLTIQSGGHYSGNPSKMSDSSRNLQQTTTLLYSQEQAVLPVQEAKHFIKVSSKDIWIAIDYESLTGKKENTPQSPGKSLTTSPAPLPQDNPAELKNLQEQMQELQKKVDEQAEEIQRLQQRPSQ